MACLYIVKDTVDLTAFIIGDFVVRKKGGDQLEMLHAAQLTDMKNTVYDLLERLTGLTLNDYCHWLLVTP